MRHRRSHAHATVRDTSLSFVSVALAFLASQHHTLHMLLLSAGVGGAGASFMTMYPTLRRLMLLMSLVMIGLTLYQAWRRQPALAVRVLTWVSAAAAFGLLVWSVGRFGL